MSRSVFEISYPVHTSVLLREAMDYLAPKPDGVYVDATLGLGGYTEAILELTEGRAKVIAVDADADSISYTRTRLEKYSDSVEYVNSNFIRIDEVLEGLGIDKVDGIVADLGLSSYQIESSGRGFSFMRDEPLDMRMDSEAKLTAADLVNTVDPGELARILKTYGEERWAKKIAKEIAKTRAIKPIVTSLELASIISRAIPRKFHPRGIHVATRTFQAIRIVVNNELGNLKTFLAKSVGLLKPGARLAVVSFHSLEDRIVKTTYKDLASDCTCPPHLPECLCGKVSIVKIITRSPVMPGLEETMENPRARSAKLRVAERI